MILLINYTTGDFLCSKVVLPPSLFVRRFGKPIKIAKTFYKRGQRK